MKLPGVVGPTYQDDSNTEICQNFFAEQVGSPSVQNNPYAKAEYLLQPTPGTRLLLEIAAATSIVAMQETLGRLFVVARDENASPVTDTLYEISHTGGAYDAVIRGILPQPAGGRVQLVTMGDTGGLLMVISQNRVHYYDLDPTPAPTIASTSFGAPWAYVDLPVGPNFPGGALNLPAPERQTAAPNEMSVHQGPGGNIRFALDWSPPDDMIGWWFIPFVDGTELPGRAMSFLMADRDCFVNFNFGVNPTTFYGCRVAMRWNEVGKYREMYFARFNPTVGLPASAVLGIFPALATQNAPAPPPVDLEHWYTDVACLADFGAELNGFFVKLDASRNEMSVSPQFGREPSQAGASSTIAWTWTELPSKNVVIPGPSRELNGVVGDTTANRLYVASDTGAAPGKLLAVVLDTAGDETAGERVAADDVGLPNAITALPTGIDIEGQRLYVVNAADDRVFVLGRSAPHARVAGEEFTYEWPVNAGYENRSVDVYVYDGLVYLLFSQQNPTTNKRLATMQCFTAGGVRRTDRDIPNEELVAAGLDQRPTHITGTGETLFIADAIAQRVAAFNAATGDWLISRSSLTALDNWRGARGFLTSAIWYDPTTTPTVEPTDTVGRMWMSGNLEGQVLAVVWDLIADICGQHPQYEWNPLQAVIRADAPDKWQAFKALRKELVTIGKKTGGVWVSTDSLFPLIPRRDVFFEVGIVAADTLQTVRDTLMWVGGSQQGTGIVYRLDGYTPMRVSTHAVERALRAVTEPQLAAATAWAYEQDGHHFYVLNVPGVANTWVFDATTELWHTRVDRDEDGNFIPFRPATHAVAFGQNIVGDRLSGKIGALTTDYWGNFNGAPFRRLRQTPDMQTERREVAYRDLIVDVGVGIGLTEGEIRDLDPYMLISWSRDSGRKFSPQVRRYLGRRGQTNVKPKIETLGSGLQLVVRMETDTLAPTWIYGGYIDAGHVGRKN